MKEEEGEHMYCPKCGAWAEDTDRTCRSCGYPLGSLSGSGAGPAGGYSESMIPEEYKPISMWGYLGYQALFSLPLIGLILVLVFSFGGTRNQNLKNFARSYFCFIIIAFVIIAIAVAVGVVSLSDVTSQINM